MMTLRLTLLSCVLAGGSAYAAYASRPEVVPMRRPLAQLPLTLGKWEGRQAPQFTYQILSILGVDEYINRFYVAPGKPYVSLYVGYYESQRQGDAIHSPMNCLPGAGWEPVRTNRLELRVKGSPDPIAVNHYLIQKGAEKQVVLYWYQSHGRVIASEYWSKAYMVYDAVRLNRTDAALVRVITPVEVGEATSEPATARAAEFVQALFPALAASLPDGSGVTVPDGGPKPSR